MKQPDNVRNRWRRYRIARRAYGFAALPFRRWVQGASPDSYRSGPATEQVPLIACRCRGAVCCCPIPN